MERIPNKRNLRWENKTLPKNLKTRQIFTSFDRRKSFLSGYTVIFKLDKKQREK